MRPVMIMLFFLLSAALCLGEYGLKKILYAPGEKKNWTEARLHCQKISTDLVHWNTDNTELAGFLRITFIDQTWIGLLRDPKNDSVWKWINIKSGEGISGEDLSQCSSWAHGEQSPNCAAVKQDFTWYSDKCSKKHYFHCSVQNDIKLYQNDLTWRGAARECKKETGDLAVITNENVTDFSGEGWIGLYREGGETWKWITDQPSDYRNWAPGQPLSADCGYFKRPSEKWYSKACSEELEFVCYGDNLVVVKENKTWVDALKHCSLMETPCEGTWQCKYRHKLLSLEHPAEYDYVRDRLDGATTDEVWTSLRFLGGEWWWVTGKRLDDSGKLPYCPSNWKHCGTVSKYSTDNWITRDCSEKRNFICTRHLVFLAR